MKTKRQISALSGSLLLLFALTVINFTGCKKDDDIKPAPDLPPQASMVMDFSDFAEADTTFLKSTDTYHNWGWAATNVLVWNTVITVHLAIPVAAFYESFNHEGVYDPNTGEWVWSYNFMAGGVIHSASLHASLSGDDINWKMYISKDNAYSNFLWYYGTTNLSNTKAVWHMSENPQHPNELILIEYEKNTQTTLEQIKYTNIKTSSPGYGGYIEYGQRGDQDFDAFYKIYVIEQDHLTNIEWSRSMKDGRVRDEIHFGDFDWRCWDTDLQDITCP